MAEGCQTARKAFQGKSAGQVPAALPCAVADISQGKCEKPEACLIAHCYQELTDLLARAPLDALADKVGKGNLKSHLAKWLHTRSGVTKVRAQRLAGQALTALNFDDLFG